jgi:hypothetical protein
VCCRAPNLDVTPTSQGSEGGGATEGGGPQDLVTDAAHDSGDPTPEPDSAAGVVTANSSPTMTKSAAEASSSRTQPGAATPEIVSKVDTITSTGDTTTGDDDELKVVTRCPGLLDLGDVSLSEVMSMAHFTLHQA